MMEAHAKRRPSMDNVGDQALTELRWEIVALGPDSDEYDQKAIDCIEFLKTLYGPERGDRK